MSRVYKVLIIDKDKDVRQALADHYFRNLRCFHAPSGIESVVRKAVNVSNALTIIARCFFPRLVLFHEDLPEEQKTQLTEKLSRWQGGVTFIVASKC